jgi:hypothetical protein
MSAASTAPPSGAPKIAPMPDPIPIETAIRPSSRDRSRARVSSEPNPALICAVGPSLPPDPPDPIVSAEAMILITTARSRMPRGFLCTALIAASVPCPSASGAHVYTRNPAASAPRTTTSGIAHGLAYVASPAAPPSPAGLGGW